MKEKRIVVAGAGIAGLTFAYKLSRAGYKVTLVEKKGEIGGLARSFEYDGFIFDIGPHRFHTEAQEVLEFIYEVLEDDFITIERKSGVWMFDKYFEWPLKPSALLRMPLAVLLSVFADFFRTAKKEELESFKGYILSRYGITLYNIFFRPYTEKFLGIKCDKISKDWAVTGIDRAVIDNKIMVNDLYQLARSLLANKPPLKFIYPGSDGIGSFAKKLGSKFMENDGTLIVNASISEIIKSGQEIKGVVIDGKTYACDLLVWTGPVTEALRLVGEKPVDLDYLSLLLFNYTVDHPPLSDYQWCYYGSEDVPFNRISIPSNFNPLLSPKGKSSLCVEVTCMSGDYNWNDPKSLEPHIRKYLEEVGLIRSAGSVIASNIEKIGHAYPIYSLDYRKKMESAIRLLGKSPNLKLLGRSGTFWYNNMDHSISAAIRLSEDVMKLL